jgi:hypothetical protein
LPSFLAIPTLIKPIAKSSNSLLVCSGSVFCETLDGTTGLFPKRVSAPNLLRLTFKLTCRWYRVILIRFEWRVLLRQLPEVAAALSLQGQLACKKSLLRARPK